MNRLLDISLFAFVAGLTFVLFSTQTPPTASVAAGIVWAMYIMSYIEDDDAGTS